MEAKSADSDDRLTPLNLAIRTRMHRDFNPSTSWRWCTLGIAGPDGERIRLQVWYVGRKPHTTQAAISDWLNKVTEARLAKIDRKQKLSQDVSDDELRAAGLLGRNDGGAK